MEVIDAIRSDNAAPDSDLWNIANPTTKSALKSLRKNLENASQSLSEDLYSSDSHFILELVQNADDNDYSAAVTPALEISLGSGNTTLVVACNETGFKENQVKAICKIGASTKKHQEGYIGEKGIGFKSVFKVADKVFISSGPYKFSFDKHAELGMITPTWEEDCPGREHWTQFTLHLSNTIDKAHLNLYLSDVDPTLLIFLRKLRHLDIDLHNASFDVERVDLEPGLVRLLRHERSTGSILTNQYLLVNHFIKTSAAEKKRPNISKTEIVLAFPLELDGSPKISKQAVHAFLPIRKYGFSFLIQGDFLTLANREDVLSDSLWNMAIRTGLVSAFLQAIEEFQRRSELALVWYRYIPVHIPTGFFSPFKDSLLAQLKKMNIFRSADGTLRRPSELLVAKYFENAPLIEERYLSKYYLSSDYDVSDRYSSILYELGVQDFSDEELINSLTRMDQRDAIRQQSTPWHGAVSAELRRLQKNRKYKKSIMALRMVPLQDGSWVSLNSGNLFFSSKVVDIPRDLGLRLLCKLDSRSSQYVLFRELGVQNADPVAVSRQILDLHQRSRPSTSVVLSHAHFLFVHRDQPGNYDFRVLYLLNKEGHLAKATDLYMDHEELGIMPLSTIISSPSHFIHQSYLTPPASSSSNSWRTWLRDVLRVNVSPRIIGGAVSSEFLQFFTNSKSDSKQVLRALRDYWPRLKPKINKARVKALGDEISLICQDGTSQRLSATAVFRKPLNTFSHLHFLRLDDPEHGDWNFLEELGVTMRPDGLLYLKWLGSLSQAKSNDARVVISIYKQLEARFDEGDNAKVIRTAFEKEPLIFVAPRLLSGGVARWLTSHEVVWNGPPSMVSKVVLKRTYPEFQTFFRTQLAISDCPSDILLRELIALTRSGSVISDEDHKRVSHILRDISDVIMDSARRGVSKPPWISQLVAHRIFPVRVANTKKLHLRKLDEKFYLPDRSRLFFEMFGNRVDMLELDEEVPFYTIQPLLDDIHQIGSHYLNGAVSRTSSSVGDRVQDAETQENYLTRAPLIARMLHATYSIPRQSKAELLQKIHNLAAFRVKSILSTYTIEDLAHSCKEGLLIEEDSDRFVILISSTCSSTEQDFQFCKQLTAKLGLKYDRLSVVICTPLSFAARYLDEEGIGQQAAGGTDDANDSWASDLSLSQVETTKAGWKTIRPKTIRAAIPDSVDRAATQRTGVLAQRAGLPDPATLIQLNMQSISDSAARQSLSLGQVSNFDLSFMSPGIQKISTDVHSTVTLTARPASTNISHPTSKGSLSFIEDSQGSIGPSVGFASIPREPRTQATPADYTNGVLGEYFIFETLRKTLPNFTVDNWTSELRGAVPGFSPYNSDSVADFTYSDDEGVLTSAVFGDAISERWSGRWPEYHIEVKSTSDQKQSPFHLSSRQLQLASQFTLPAHEIPTAVYVLVRVWDLRSTSRSYTVFPDPHRSLYTGGLKIVSDIQAVLT